IIKYTEEEFRHRELLGKRIVELRHKYGLTQEELADKVKIASRSLSEIENGKCCPNAIIVYRIARALDITLFEFYEFKEENKVVIK
ncbi:MAG: helix-turn-helix domain-containing protein, partial [Anaeroplasmataceae bacterium]|nr:helix-turn-helix domain-containing protein [Anaeroplasmataceae bacterium]